MSNGAKKVYTNIGTMMKSKKRDPNDPNEQPRFYIKLKQQRTKDGKAYGEEIFPIKLANGKELKDGDILSMFSSRDSLKRSVEAGRLTQDKADEMASYLIFDICVAESVNEGSDDEGNVPF